MKSIVCTLILALGAAIAKADTISIVLDQASLTAAPNTTVNFTGTITNLTNAPLYFTGSGSSFTSTASYGIGPSYPFGSTMILAPGASSGDTVLLNVDVPANPDPSVTFTGTLNGGPSPTSSGDLGSFAVTLNAGPALSAPEIDPSLAASGLTLLAGAFAILRERRSRLQP